MGPCWWRLRTDCPICGRPLEEKGYLVCSLCRQQIRAHREKMTVFYAGYRTSSVAPYQGDFRRAHLSFKYQGQTWLARYMAALMLQAYLASGQRTGLETAYVSFIPAAPCRLGQKGYHVPQLLARHFARQTGARYVNVLKGKNRPQQTGLSRPNRLANMTGALSLKRAGRLDRGRPFFLLDDVTTTGATLAEGVRVLKAGGFSQIICLTFLKD